MRLKICTLFFSVCFTLSAWAQQEAQFSQYMFNNIYLNPAFAGLEVQPTFALFYRAQWAGYNASFDDGGAPVTQVFSFNAPLTFANSGVAFHVVNDRLGPVNNLEAQVSYAYHLAVDGGRAKLSLGVRGGIFSQTLDYDLYRFIDENDPLLIDATGRDNQVRPDIAAGVFYSAPKFYIGASATRLLEAEFSFADNISNPLERTMYVTGGYIWEVAPDWTVTPSVLVKSDFNSYSFDLSAIATYREKFWGGLSYRDGDAAIVLLGMNVMEDKQGEVRLRAGYSFDYTVSGVQGKSPTSHELFITYALPRPKVGNRVQQGTPRYNH